MNELLRRRELRIVIINALTQPLGAIVLALGIIIGLLVWTPFFAVGVVGYLLIVLATLRDEAENRRVIEAELHPPRTINLSTLRGRYRTEVEKALSTQRQIDRAVATASPDLRDMLRRLTADVDDLVGAIYDIAVKAQDVEESLRAIDRSSLGQEIAYVQHKVASATSEYLRDQYQATLEAKRQQLASLSAVDEALQRWQAQLAYAQASLGDILSQILKIKSSAILQATLDSDGLSAQIRSQTTALRETAKALDTLYASTRP